MLSKQAIDEFKQAYRERYGKELSDAEALDVATRFILRIKAIYKPVPVKK